MVFFTCGNCGESIKKPSIAKHYMGKCRGPPNVTCVDCLKDFRGNEYEAHIKCVTEEERYAAKGYVAKASSNKGEKKQQSWSEAMQSILNSDRQLRPDERELLTVLSNHENLPRKKGKFINFISNAHRMYAKRQELVDRVWNIIEEVGKAATGTTNSGEKEKEIASITETNGKAAEESVEKNKKKKSTLEENSNELNGKKKKKSQEEATEAEEHCNGTSDKKRKKRKTTEDTEVAGKKLKLKTNPVSQVLTEENGTISLYKLRKTLTQKCANVAGSEKGEKLLKKIEKSILIETAGENIVINLSSLDSLIEADDGLLTMLVTAS